MTKNNQNIDTVTVISCPLTITELLMLQSKANLLFCALNLNSAPAVAPFSISSSTGAVPSAYGSHQWT